MSVSDSFEAYYYCTLKEILSKRNTMLIRDGEEILFRDVPVFNTNTCDSIDKDIRQALVSHVFKTFQGYIAQFTTYLT